MTKTKAAPKSAEKKKEAAKPAATPATTGAPSTGDLPLKGGKDGTTRSLDNSRVIKKPIPPEIVNKAQLFAQARDRMDIYKEQAVTHGNELLDMMLKEALPTDIRIRVDTDRGVRFISYKDTGVTLVVENAKGRPPEDEKKKDAAKPADKKPEAAAAKK